MPGIGACGNTASGPSIPVTITGNSVVFVEGPINENDKANWNGLIGQARDANGNPSRRGIRTAKLYGTTVEPAFAFEIPSGFTLDIEAGKTLGVHNGVSMNNLGTVNVSGTLDYTGGKLYNSGTITKVGQGQIIPDDSIVTVAPAAIAMAAQSGSPVYGDNIALQATVTGANGSGGTVEFFVNGTPAGTATPDSSGVASLSSQAVTPLWHGGANSVYAVFSGGTGQASAKSDAVTYNVAKKPLAAPANVAWTTGSGNATVSWNAVDHATYYTVQLLKDGQAQGLPLYVYNTTGAASVNWTFPLTAAGSYTAQVTAVGDTNYANAQATTAVAVNTVSFNAGVAGSGASGMPSLQGVLAGGTYTRPGDPTCTGYVFSHWTAPDGGNPFASGNTTTVGSPLLLTANWGLEAMTGVRWGGQTQAAWNAVPNAHDYLVTLYDNSGAAPVAVGTASNVLPPNPATPTVTYDFSNMTAPGTYSFSVQALGDTGVTGNAPVSSPVVSSVTFDMNGATSTAIPARFVQHGSAVGAVAAPTRTGCTFLGWTGNGITTPAMDISGQTVSGQQAYTANWQMNTVQNAAWGTAAADGTSATATWDALGAGVSGYSVQLYKSVNGGAAVAAGQPVSVSGGTAGSVDVPITPEEGAVYTFTVTPTGTGAGTASASAPSNELNTVTFVPENSGATTYQLVADGGHATQPTAPTWSTNVFQGWRTAPTAANYNFAATAVNDPVTLHGMWKQGQVPQNVQVSSPNQVSWDAVPGATGYVVNVCASADGGTAYPAAVPQVTTTGTSATLAPTGAAQTGVQYASVQATSTNQWFETLGTGTGAYGTAPAYLVTFDANGGSLASGAAKGAVVAPNAGVGSALSDPTRGDYNFAGWKNGSASVDGSTPVTASGTYTASWQLVAQPANLAWNASNPQAPTLSWTAAPGAAGYTVTLLRDGTPVPGTPAVNGTTASFAGMMDQPGTYTVSVQATADKGTPSAAVTSPAIHSAQFVPGTAGSAATDMPALSFAVKGGSVAKPGTDPKATGYTFAGWRDAAGNDPFAAGAYTMGDGPVTFTAAWNLTAPTGLGWAANHTTATWDVVSHATGYQVTLTGPGSTTKTFTVAQPTSGSTASVDMGGSMTQAGTYSFSVQAIGDSTVGNSATSTVAQPVHTVTFDGAGGSTPVMGYALNNTAATSLPTPTRDGYTFAGWTLNGQAYTSQPVTAPVTLVATWRANTYKVTFDANGGDPVAEQSFTFDAGLANLPVPTRTGADFAGWYDASGNKVTSIPAGSKDVVLTAHWTCKAPVWDASNPGTASWAEIPGAGSYTATLMKRDASGNWSVVSGAEQTVTAGSGKNATADFASQVMAAGAGTYAVTVSAAGVGGTGAAATSAVSNNLYTVSVDENHGATGTDAVKQLVVDGSKVVVSALGTPQWANNTFKGWTEQLQDRALGTAYAAPAVHAPVTLYAQWQLAAPTFAATASGAWTVSASSPTDATLAWQPVTGAAGYTAQLQANGTDKGSAQTTDTKTLSAAFTGLTDANTTYTAQVSATGAMGILDSDAAASPGLYTVAWEGGTTDSVTGLPTSPRLAPAGSTVSRPATNPSRTGYTFGGWQAAGASVLAPNSPYTVNGPVTFTAVWDLAPVTGVAWGANNTSATFDEVAGAEKYIVHVAGSAGAPSQGVAVDAAKATVAGGKVTVDLSAAMKTAGTYTFSVEATATGMKPAAPTAVGTSVHSVSFVMNGATSAAEAMRFVQGGQTVGTVTEPTRDGATFNGWTGGALTVATKDISAQKVTAPVTYTAAWTMNEPTDLEWRNASGNDVTASWDAVAGATEYAVTVYNGNNIVQTAKVTNHEYTYTVPADETGTWTFSVVAQGTNAADSQAAALPTSAALCSVTFDGNGATAGVPSRQLVVSGGHAVQPANPARTGYSFSRWALKSAPAAAYDFASTAVTGAITLQAQWTQDVYNITYQTNGGTNPSGAPTTYTYDAGVTLPTPTRDGYTFDGWCLQKDLSDTPVRSIAAASATGDKAFYAKWSVNTYTVTFDGNAPAGSTVTVPSPESFVFDQGLDPLKDASSTDYDFVGWNTKADGTGQTLASIAPDSQPGNVTLYAQWRCKAPVPTSTANNTVTWQPVAGATAYEVQVLDATGAVAPTSEVTATVSGTTATLAPTDDASGKSYTVQVKAVNAPGAADSNWSSAVSFHAVTFDAASGALPAGTPSVALVGDG